MARRAERAFKVSFMRTLLSRKGKCRPNTCAMSIGLRVRGALPDFRGVWPLVWVSHGMSEHDNP